MVCRSTDRSTSQRSFFRQLGLSVNRTQVLTYRSTARSTEARTRELVSLVGQPLSRPGPDPSVNCLVNRPLNQGLCTLLCTSVYRSVDRPLVQSTDRSTARSPKSGFKALKSRLVKPIKILINPINFTKIVSLKYFEVQICVIKIQHILQTC